MAVYKGALALARAARMGLSVSPRGPRLKGLARPDELNTHAGFSTYYSSRPGRGHRSCSNIAVVDGAGVTVGGGGDSGLLVASVCVDVDLEYAGGVGCGVFVGGAEGGGEWDLSGFGSDDQDVDVGSGDSGGAGWWLVQPVSGDESDGGDDSVPVVVFDSGCGVGQ